MTSPWKKDYDYDAETPSSPCPNCGKVLDKATSANLDGHKPRPGDVSVCWKCKAILVFNNDLILMNPAEEELVLIKQHPDIKRILSVLKSIEDR